MQFEIFNIPGFYLINTCLNLPVNEIPILIVYFGGIIK